MFIILAKMETGWTFDGPYVTNKGANKNLSKFCESSQPKVLHKHEIKPLLKKSETEEDLKSVLTDALEKIKERTEEFKATRAAQTVQNKAANQKNHKWNDHAIVPLNLTRDDIRDMIHFLATNGITRTKGTALQERSRASWKEFMSAKAWWIYEFLCSQGLRIVAIDLVKFITLEIDPPGGVPAGLDEHIQANRKLEGWKLTDRIWSSNSYKP